MKTGRLFLSNTRFRLLHDLRPCGLISTRLQQAELIKRCKKGQRQAQEELYQRYSRILYAICLRYSRNKAEAEDNLHDSFMTIYDKIGQYNSKGSFEGWIKRVTVNTVLQKYRKESPLTLLTEEIEDQDSGYSTRTELSLATLLRYIQELPKKYRLTFNLYVMDGYSHKEIGEKLGTTAGTSKSNLARARMILREKISKARSRIA